MKISKGKIVLILFVSALVLAILVPYLRFEIQLANDKSRLLEICAVDQSEDYEVVKSDEVVLLKGVFYSSFLSQVEPKAQFRERYPAVLVQFELVDPDLCEDADEDEYRRRYGDCYSRFEVHKPSDTVVEITSTRRPLSRLSYYTKREVTLTIGGRRIGRRVQHHISYRPVQFLERLDYFYCGEESRLPNDWIKDLLEKIR